MTTLAPGDARSRLETAVELLRREWRDGCPAGMAYQTALGSVRRLRPAAASEQITDDLSRVINDLEAYATLPPERRPVALTEIAAAITRLIPLVARLEAPAPSIATFENEPTRVAVQDNRPIQDLLSEPSPSPAAVITALHRLSPSEFERLVASLLQAQGFTGVQVTGGVDDRGVDIIGHDIDGRLVAVQCKRFAPTSTVSALTVQHLVGMAVKRKAHQAMLVTTGNFTGPARTQAKDFDIELIDGPMLASLIAVHPELVAALDIGEVRPVQVGAEGQPSPSVPVAPARPPAARETYTNGSWLFRLTHRLPALTEENMAAVMEWGKKRVCPPNGEGCRGTPWTPRQSWNNCGWFGRCPVGLILDDNSRGITPGNPWHVWIDGRTGKGRLTQKGRRDIT